MNKQEPSIRFKGFIDAWELYKLGDIGKTFTGLSGKTSNDFGHGEAKFLPYLNIFNNPIADINFLESTEKDNRQNEIKYGDIFFTTSSETPEEVGMSSVWLGNSGNIYLNSFCFGFRPLIDFNPYYFGYLLRSDSFRKPVTVLAQGISRFNISKNKVMEINIPLPEKLEQEKIGRLFYEFDYLITLYQRKLDKLKVIKTSLLDTMFPHDNEVVPSIRFKGFTDAWEQRKLEELGKIETGNTPATSNLEYYSDNGLLWITPTDITSNITTKTVKYLSDKGEKVARVVPGNSTLCTCIASIGKNTFCPIKCAFNQQINALSPHISNDPYFIFTDSYHWSNTMKKGAGGLTFQIVNKTEFSNIETYIPLKQEQEKIGQLFYKLDSLITLHQCKIDKLKVIKSSLLDKMFI